MCLAAIKARGRTPIEHQQTNNTTKNKHNKTIRQNGDNCQEGSSPHLLFLNMLFLTKEK